MKRKLKILVFAPYFYPHKGGVENYVFETGKRLVRKGHRVEIITKRLKGTKKYEKKD